MLDKIISEKSDPHRLWEREDLNTCLHQISAHIPNIREDKRFKKLEEFWRRSSV